MTLDAERCRNLTKEQKQQIPLTAWFQKRPPDWVPPQPQAKKRIVKVPCVGLTDQSWPCESKYKISDCIEKSPNVYPRGERLDEVCKRLFGTSHKDHLNEDQLSELSHKLQSQATWMIDQNQGIESPRSMKCLRVIPQVSTVDLHVCTK